MSLPMAPTYDGPCAKLRQVLHEWEKKPKGCGCVTYLLKHRYSDVDFRRGASCLKGEDDEILALVRVVAEELGFLIFLAMKNGTDHWCRCQDRRRFTKYDNGASISLFKMVDLSGHVVLSPNHSTGIDKDCFLQTARSVLDSESSHDSGEEDSGNVSCHVR
jgi:hypothetical protein